MRASIAAGLAFSLLGSSAVFAGELDISRVQTLSAAAQEASEGANDDYLAGDPQKALARLRSIEKTGDAEAAFVLGNMTWVMHPAESFAWHRQALEWGGDNAAVQLELALHYTRQENCPEAVRAWRRVEAAGELQGYFPAVAAYCLLVLGQDREAFAMFALAKFGKVGKFEGLLEEIWGERPTLASFADAMAALRAGKSTDASEAMKFATALPGYDGQRARVFAVMLEASNPVAKTDPALKDLACLRPWIDDDLRRGALYRERNESYDFPDEAQRKRERASQAEALRSALDGCGFVLGEGRLPASDSLARVLLSDVMEFQLATAKELLERHGAGLKARAESEAGDVEALSLLAALQLRAEDRAGLAQSDRYGWERYRDARFAASRVAGLGAGTAEEKASVAAEARRALKDFPDSAYVLMLVLTEGDLKGEERKRALRSQVLAEFHGLTAESVLHASKSARRLVEAFVEYRDLVQADSTETGG
ncbi:hypothetical protein [Arenimonas sp.]|uniref:hypothetical protein n=1 Tax=Arenimonas sp. TaxID=1872635 RepID=UPI0039E6F810